MQAVFSIRHAGSSLYTLDDNIRKIQPPLRIEPAPLFNGTLSNNTYFVWGSAGIRVRTIIIFNNLRLP